MVVTVSSPCFQFSSLTGMNASDSFTITSIEFCPIDVPLVDPFVVATSQLHVAQNAFVRVTLNDGTIGYGEIAPFPGISDENRETSLVQAQVLGNHLLGRSALTYQRLGRELAELAPDHPAARCGVETALLDALTRATKLPLWALWGGADVRPRETDVTIPITSVERTLELARTWHDRGFRVFKMKVGHDVDDDIRRLEAIHRQYADISFLIDPNQGYTREEAACFIQGVTRSGANMVLLEQPLARDDLEGHARLQRDFQVHVAVDESARSLNDLKAVIQQRAANYLNVKITKSGVLEGMAMAAFAKASGLHVMIGGMVETRVAMGCSYGLVMGLGHVDVLDLDTPLLLGTDPVTGGYTYNDASLQPWDGPGLDLDIPCFQSTVSLSH